MAFYEFRTPARIEVPLSHSHPLWRRVREKVGVCLVQHQDDSWEEFEDLPQLFDANADYLFGRTDRSPIPGGKGFGVTQDTDGTNLVTPADYGYQSPKRIYRGGHVYVVDDALKAELDAAVTTQEAGGYGAYVVEITPTQGRRIGDEILVSGFHFEHEPATPDLTPFPSGSYTGDYEGDY